MKMRFSEASVNLSFFSGLGIKLDLARPVWKTKAPEIRCYFE